MSRSVADVLISVMICCTCVCMFADAATTQKVIAGDVTKQSDVDAVFADGACLSMKLIANNVSAARPTR